MLTSINLNRSFYQILNLILSI